MFTLYKFFSLPICLSCRPSFTFVCSVTCVAGTTGRGKGDTLEGEHEYLFPFSVFYVPLASRAHPNPVSACAMQATCYIINFCFPRSMRFKTSNFHFRLATIGAKLKTGDSRAVTSLHECLVSWVLYSSCFHSEYLKIPLYFVSTHFSFLHTKNN